MADRKSTGKGSATDVACLHSVSRAVYLHPILVYTKLNKVDRYKSTDRSCMQYRKIIKVGFVRILLHKYNQLSTTNV